MYAALAIAVFVQPGFAHPGDIAVIVNRQNATDEVSFKELVEIFKQERQYWEGGQKIQLIMQEAGNPEKEAVLRHVYKMKRDEELKQFWLAKLFKGEISTFPRTLASNESMKAFVSRVPAAIGFIDASVVDESVKVLRIEGKLPGEERYALGEQ